MGLVGLALIAVGAFIASGHAFGTSAWTKAGVVALETVGGALLAAVVVGYLVDQITRHKLSRETGEQWLWALLGEDTPHPLRERAKDVISHGQAYLSVDFQCTMAWDTAGGKKVLRLRIHVITDGINHSRNESFLPDGAAWAMASVSGGQTRYLKWIFEAFDKAGEKAPRRLEADEALIARNSHGRPPDDDDFEPDGSVFLYNDELIAEIAKHQAAPEDERPAAPGERFRLERDVELVLDPTDFFPFFIVVPTVELRFTFSGAPCEDLAIKARASGTTMKETKTGPQSIVLSPEGALLPGNVVIFSWHPRPSSDDREANGELVGALVDCGAPPEETSPQ